MTREEAKFLDGINAAFAHAVSMHSEGKLTEKELDSVRRYMIRECINQMPMDQYVAARKSGAIEKLWAEAGHDPRGDADVSDYDLDKSRKGLAQRVVSDMLGQMWDGGYIDDATYSNEMRRIGVDRDPEMDIKKDNPERSAVRAWNEANGIKNKEPETPAEKDRAVLEKEDSEMLEYAKEFRARQERKESHGSAIERERVVAPPADHAALTEAA